MITSKKFLNAVAAKGKYTFISTGMSEMKDIENAVEIFKKNKCDFELMHCVSKYPADSNILIWIASIHLNKNSIVKLDIVAMKKV